MHPTLEVSEITVVEEEFKNGKLVKRTSTTTKPKVIPRDLPPLTPLDVDNPWRKIVEPWKKREEEPRSYIRVGPPPSIMW